MPARELLRQVGFKPGVTGGMIDRQAVVDFQRHYGLTVDGLIGKQTLSALQRELVRRKSKQGGAGAAGGGALAGGNEAVAPESTVEPGIIGDPWITAVVSRSPRWPFSSWLTSLGTTATSWPRAFRALRHGSPAGCAYSERRKTMWNRLAGPLADAGLNVLGGIIGGKAGPIMTTVGGAVLRELGVTTSEQGARKIESDPEAVASSQGSKRSAVPNGRQWPWPSSARLSC